MMRSPLLLILLTAGLALAPGAPVEAQSTPAPAASPVRAPATADFAAAADYSAGLAGRAMLVMVDGKIVFERADNGWDMARMHPLASGTKSFSGVIAARAIQDGLISSFDELAADTLTEWKNNPRKAKITIRHLLSLSSGLEPGDETVGSAGGGRVLGPGTETRRDRTRGRTPADDKAAAALALPMKHAPGSTFEYGPSHYYAFGEVLRRKLVAAHDADPAKFPETDVLAYMTRTIFEPIGLKVGRFGKDGAGNPNLPGGCMLAPAEWAKFGEMVRLQGKWPSPAHPGKEPPPPQTIVKSDLLAELFKPSAANPAYGLTWWLINGKNNSSDAADGLSLRERLVRRGFDQEVGPAVTGPDGKPLTVMMAAGLGKQRLFVIPQYSMVIVRFAENTAGGRAFGNERFLRLALGLAGSPDTKR
ncbi:MAG: serine hydrolase domain-containing protein [Phycisphaerales bacterium]